ncbi:hypothetical protein [Bacillus sp. AFS053548]|uniref:hypothetical protein n=1 Tax=Bacillus sp. AFS053548 TaxID=2033505 RepID=UPI000BFB502E|nr:hypothetical protein [Bacillus sp. AFS053548]PGM53854.1 hypothetical protein CN946_16695 [Bacillus sp. AFS053548]
MEKNINNEVINEVFFVDGSLRDIYVFKVDINGWLRLYELVHRSPWNITLYIDGQISEYENKTVYMLFKEKENHSIMMTININGILFNCYFFSDTEIEFDIDPNEIKSETDVKKVFEFMKKISMVLGKESILTVESDPDNPLVTVHSDGSLLINI